jgi:hypothetical protein
MPSTTGRPGCPRGRAPKNRLTPPLPLVDRWGSERLPFPSAMDGLDLSRQRPRRRGPFRRAFPVGSLSGSSVGSPFGRTRSGSTSALRSVTVSLRPAAEEGWDGCGRPTCDAGGSSCDPPFGDCAPDANGTIIVGSSCSLGPMIPPTPIVSMRPAAARPRSRRQSSRPCQSLSASTILVNSAVPMLRGVRVGLRGL